MQSLSTFYPKGASFIAPSIDCHAPGQPVLRGSGRRRNNRSGPLYSSSYCCCRGFCGGLRGPDSVSSISEMILSRSRGIGYDKYSAVCLGLQQESGGIEDADRGGLSRDKSKDDVGFGASVGFENVQISSYNEQSRELEVSDNRDGFDFVENGRVNVRALAANLGRAKDVDEVGDILKRIDDLPLPVYSTIIKSFGYDNKVDSAFFIVEWLKRKNKDTNGMLGPNLFIYNSLLSAVKQAKRFDQVEKVLDDMKAEGIVPNIVTYNSLIAIYLEQGRPNEALDVVAEIEKNSLPLTHVTYSTILAVYKKMDDATGALGYFVKLREKYQKGEIGKGNDHDWENEFVKLENFTIRLCQAVMRQWLVSKEEPAAEVLKLLSEMDNARVRPSRVDYERLVWACTQGNHYAVALELYKRIREMDDNISLSVCNHIIWLMGKAKRWWAALEIYEDLLDKGPKPNNLSYELVVSHFNILLAAAKRKGIWRWGVRLLNKMQEKGLRPGSREWNSVLVACSKAAETSAAVQIFTRMVEQGEKPTILSYGALLSALEKGKLYDDALRVWEHMQKVGVKPNLHAYTILVSIYIGKGSLEMVDSVFLEMKSMNIEPTVVTYNAIITGCVKSNLGAAAFEWYNRMEVQNIKPNKVTYEMLVEALGKDGKPRLAYEMYQRARNEGLHLSSNAYDVVVETCQVYGPSMDLSALGPRPIDKKNTKIRRNLSDFCRFADLPRRSKPFQRKELSSALVQEG